MQRIPTGIPGLDELIEGGFPEGASILLSGGPGSGKTIGAMQFIYEGARTYNEPGIYVTMESNLKDITWNMQRFQWDIKSLQEKNLMKIYRLNLGNANNGLEMEEQVRNSSRIITKFKCCNS
jgi:KaiC/GvpD/RAD55 family RecA-like ATPase